MLSEERQMVGIVAEQKALAEQLVTAATARCGAGKGTQAEVLRAVTDVARLDLQAEGLNAFDPPGYDRVEGVAQSVRRAAPVRKVCAWVGAWSPNLG